MFYDPRVEREYYPFSRSPSNEPPNERNDGLDRKIFEDENFANKSIKRTLHHPRGCMHCRVYSRHIDESASPDFGLFTESSSHHSQGIPHRTYEDGIRLGRYLQEEEDYHLLVRYREQFHQVHERHENSLLTKARYRHELECMQEEIALLKDQLVAIQIAYDDVTASVGNSSAGRWETSSIHGIDRAEAKSWEHHEQNTDEDYFDIVQQIHIEEERRQQDVRDWSDLDEHSITSESESPSLSSVSTISSLSDEAQPPPPIRPRHGEEAEELTVEYVSSLMAAARTCRDAEALDQVRLLIHDAQRTHKSKRTAAQLYLLLNWRIPSLSSVSVPSTLSTSSLNSGPTTGRSTVSPEIFVDASAYGIGFILNNHWLAWTFVRGHPDIPMGPDDNIVMSWAELIAAEMGILTFIGAGHRSTQVILRSDNDGVIAAFKKRTWTKNFGLDEILKRVLKICQDANLVVIPTWIPTKANPADKPSRGVYAATHLMFDPIPAIPSYLQSVLKLAGV